MEIQRTKTATVQPAVDSFHDFDIADDFQERLNSLLAENARIDKEKALFRNLSEKTEAEMMRHPINTKNAFAYFGLFLGIFPPAAFFLKF